MADHRKDPVAKELFSVGDRVVVCANCKTVYLESSWKIKGHCFVNQRKCEEKNTLSEIPGEKTIQKLNNKAQYNSLASYYSEYKKTEKKAILYKKWIITLCIFSVLLILAIIYYNNTNQTLLNENSYIQNQIQTMEKDKKALNIKLESIQSENQDNLIKLDVANKKILDLGKAIKEQEESLNKKETYSNGYYIGTFNNNGQRHGLGTYIWNDGDKYEGNWRYGERTGFGIYYWKNGGCWYGIWKGSERDGIGVSVNRNNISSIEKWINGKKQ